MASKLVPSKQQNNRKRSCREEQPKIELGMYVRLIVEQREELLQARRHVEPLLGMRPPLDDLCIICTPNIHG